MQDAQQQEHAISASYRMQDAQQQEHGISASSCERLILHQPQSCISRKMRSNRSTATRRARGAQQEELATGALLEHSNGSSLLSSSVRARLCSRKKLRDGALGGVTRVRALLDRCGTPPKAPSHSFSQLHLTSVARQVTLTRVLRTTSNQNCSLHTNFSGVKKSIKRPVCK